MIEAVAYARRGVQLASAALTVEYTMAASVAMSSTGPILPPRSAKVSDGTFATPISPRYNTSSGARHTRNIAVNIAARRASA